MKILLLMLVTLLIHGMAAAQSSIYVQPVRDIDGKSIQLANYSTKKIMFILLSVNDADVAFTDQLLRFQERWDDSIHVIGIIVMEDGYTAEQKEELKALYAPHMKAGLVLTEELYVRKESDMLQSPLVRWLTNKHINLHFNEDADEVGTKFFVSQAGELYAVLGADIALDAPLINKVVDAPIK